MPPSTWFDTLTLVAAWLVYFVIHSALASLALKRRVAVRWPGFMPAYRLVYNALAVVLLLPIAWIMAARVWPSLWQWHGAAKVAADTLSILALAGFVWSLRYYDLQEFLGLRQWRGHVRAPEDQEHLQISTLHRFVRHPWYFFALVLLWARDLDTAQFVSNVMISAYLVVGARLEERKLLVYHGERYRLYMQRVPGLLPLPWKFIDAAEAERLRGD